MKRLRWLLALLAALLLATGGLVAWASYSGYPYPVQYRQSIMTVRYPLPGGVRTALVQQWFDPAHGNDRIMAATGYSLGDILIQAGRYYGPLPPQGIGVRHNTIIQWMSWNYEQGCGANDGMLPSVPARVVGSVTYDRAIQAYFRCERSQRLAPYTLPATFFAPPAPEHPSLWDRFTGWLYVHAPH